MYISTNINLPLREYIEDDSGHSDVKLAKPLPQYENAAFLDILRSPHTSLIYIEKLLWLLYLSKKKLFRKKDELKSKCIHREACMAVLNLAFCALQYQPFSSKIQNSKRT